MLVGGFLGMSCLTPSVGHGEPGDTYEMVRGVIVGTILGGIAWKVLQVGRDST